MAQTQTQRNYLNLCIITPVREYKETRKYTGLWLLLIYINLIFILFF